MKRLIGIFIILLCIVTVSYAQHKKGFVLNGKIEGLKNGSVIYLVSVSPRIDTISKTISKGEIFTLTGSIEGETNYFFIRVDTTINKISKKGHLESVGSNALWLINDKMSLKGKLAAWDNLALSGSEPQGVWEAFRDLQEKYAKTPTSQYRVIKKDFIKSHLHSLFIPYIINTNALTKEDLVELYSNLSNRVKQSYYGLKLTKEVEILKNQDLMQKTVEAKDGYIQDFEITNPEGKRISILELAGKAKYTLIDFWASWCVPCRAAIPNLKKVYDAFHTKGFNIVGISTDENEVAWKKAIVKDNTLWNHGLDNVVKMSKIGFEIRGIPSYILIDGNGKIIQSDVSSATFKPVHQFWDKNLHEDLYEIIEQLLKCNNP